MAEDAIRGLGVQRPIDILPNSISLKFVDAHSRAGEPNREDRNVIRVIYAGRFDNMKGAHILDSVVRSLREIPNTGSWSFYIAGTYSDLRSYPAIASRKPRNVRVNLLGPVSAPQLLGLFRKADVFFFPSHAENCPMAVLEAMACGLPVVASSIGGIPDLVAQSSEGILCPREDVPAFVQALLDLRDTERRKWMGTKARIRIEQEFTAEHIARRWLEMCRKA
jgi:glycosyltransferase involved in cell wall biosynthesis